MHAISDHDLVTFRISSKSRTKRVATTFSYRKLADLDTDSFKHDLANSELFTSPAESADSFAEQIDTVTSSILDKYCPLRTRTKLASSHPDNRWLTPEALTAKRRRRQLERKWKKYQLEADRLEYRKACRAANKAILESRSKYYSGRILEANIDVRRRWTAIKDVLHQAVAPEHTSSTENSNLCNNFINFFNSKIQRIKTNLISQSPGIPANDLYADKPHKSESLTNISLPSSGEVLKLIGSMPAKSSPMDKIPTTVIKLCPELFAHLIARLASLSFSTGVFPFIYKIASVTPLIKKANLDRNDPANFRPISNLHTISKILERLFLTRIMQHIELSPNFNHYQSAYRRGHSTETTLLRLVDDIYGAVDNKSETLLASLDLSAAFDCINIPTLVRRLEYTFGFSGTALQWLTSYLSQRQQFVRVGDCKSNTVACIHGVPQGSVLGPLLFSLYISPISNIIAKHGIRHAQYADDTQLYTELKVNNNSTDSALQTCFLSLCTWFSTNGLSLNPDKSEAIIFSGKQSSTSNSQHTDIDLAGSKIAISSKVTSLGVTLDCSLTFTAHISNICQKSHFHIRALRHIRKCLTDDDAKTVASALVGARLDYCNSLFFGISKCNINKLQLIQNTLARVVTGVNRRHHITPILQQLHWLPIQSRIHYKIAIITFKTLKTSTPAYLADLLQLTTSSTRSASHHRLLVNHSRTSFGRRAFSHSSAAIWNSLPPELTSHFDSMELSTFKRHLKTHLFKKHFDL